MSQQSRGAGISARGRFDTRERTESRVASNGYKIKVPSKKPVRGYRLPSFSPQSRVPNRTSIPKLVVK